MTSDRKKDHIDLAFKSRPTEKIGLDNFTYEPMLSAHPEYLSHPKQEFLGFEFRLPFWISSMTGGTERAKLINENLAKGAEEFGLGLGLGSCRPLLSDDKRFDDFDIKKFMPTRPLFTNFGIAQLEELVARNSLGEIDHITKSLNADGIIIHVNPLQEWGQPEGDRFKKPPLDTIKSVLAKSDFPLIVKEVGQGFGPKSMKSLMELPLAAIEFGAYGGTNFTILELARLSRSLSGKKSDKEDFGHIGHDALEMIDFANEILNASDSDLKCREFIISGGVSSGMQGFILNESLRSNSVVGMAASFLKHAMGEYSELQTYMLELRSEYLLASAYIKRK